MADSLPQGTVSPYQPTMDPFQFMATDALTLTCILQCNNFLKTISKNLR